MEGPSQSSIWQRQRSAQALPGMGSGGGVFEAIWKAGLAEYDQMEGISWRWQSIDGALFKAPLAQETVGRNPTDRGKKGKQATPAGGRPWRPVVARRDRGERA
jgi:hypothetical protein